MLYEQNLLIFHNYNITIGGLHFAWSHSNQWPSCLQDPDPNKFPIRRHVFKFGNDSEALAEVQEQGRRDWDEDLRDTHPRFDLQDLNQAVGMLNAVEDEDSVSSSRQWHISAAIEIALVLQQRSTAEDLWRQRVSDFTATDNNPYSNRQNFFAAQRVWEILCEEFVAGELSVSEEEITEYVEGILATLIQRFENGPERPFKDKPTKELVQTLDKIWLEIKL